MDDLICGLFHPNETMEQTFARWDKEREAQPWYQKAWDLIDRKIRNTYRFCRYDIHQGLAGLIYWAPFAWKYRTWDYAWGLEALRMHLVKLEIAVRTGHHLNGKRDAKDIRVAISLMKRIEEDNYWRLAEKSNPYNYLKNELPIRHHSKQGQEDWNYLFNLMRKRSKHWWD